MKKFLWMLCLLLATIAAIAQKLPDRQQSSLRAPADTKIDGKATGFNGKFEAYNHATEIFYTLCNNDDYLYLTAKTTVTDIISKLAGGGLTLIISEPNQKKRGNGIAITFPAYEGDASFHFLNMKNRPSLGKADLKGKLLVDSFATAVNHQLAGMCKLVKVEGIKLFADSLISVYNEDGIKAAIFFNNQYACIYQMAVPLKYLRNTITSMGKFDYTIKLNGGTANKARIEPSRNGLLLYVIVDHQSPYAFPATPQFMAIAYPTEFSGEYTLAKKQ